jgi:hypothetical protein
MKTTKLILLVGTIFFIAMNIKEIHALYFNQSAPPQIPASFYGTITAVSASLSSNTAVSAHVNGVEYAQTTLLQHEGQWVYTLKVPADDPATEAVEGGKPGDTIEFYLDGTPTGQTAVWQSGVNTSFDLSLPTLVTAETPTTTLSTWLIWAVLAIFVGLLLWFWQKRRGFIASRT